MRRDYSKFGTQELKQERENAKSSLGHWTDTHAQAERIIRDRLETIQEIDMELSRRNFEDVAWRADETRH